MKLVTWRPEAGGDPRIGALDGDAVVDLAAAFEALPSEDRRRLLHGAPFPRSMLELLALGSAGMSAAASALRAGAARRPLGEARLLAPVPRPGKILGIGRNYGAHAAEGGLEAQEKPRILLKAPSSVIGPGEPILKPASVSKLDYEVELAIVIGRPARDVAEADVLAHIAGCTILNDVSARELQFDVSPPQTSFAKSMDGFCPMGPCLATLDEFADPAAIRLSCRVNGELVQDGDTRDMIFPVPVLIAYLSRFLTLEPGDVIATGTPAGVGAFRTPPRYLEPGDLVRMEIAEIGVLENRIA
jgi:2-keto-4-pentenoate hydratase/2-oxohepta-3-ene-1,7-dioic acid hydratase in catechol pathway